RKSTEWMPLDQSFRLPCVSQAAPPRIAIPAAAAIAIFCVEAMVWFPQGLSKWKSSRSQACTVAGKGHAWCGAHFASMFIHWIDPLYHVPDAKICAGEIANISLKQNYCRKKRRKFAGVLRHLHVNQRV